MLSSKLLKKAVITENSSLRMAMTSIKTTGLNMAIVVNKCNSVVGVVSDGDIRKQLLIDENMDELVTSCMSENFVYILENYEREEVLKLLDRRISRIPVLDHNKHFLSPQNL